MLCDCELGIIQQYNIYSKTAAFFEKSGSFTYLGLAAALAAWYNVLKRRSYYEKNIKKNRRSTCCSVLGFVYTFLYCRLQSNQSHRSWKNSIQLRHCFFLTCACFFSDHHDEINVRQSIFISPAHEKDVERIPVAMAVCSVLSK